MELLKKIEKVFSLTSKNILFLSLIATLQKIKKYKLFLKRGTFGIQDKLKLSERFLTFSPKIS